MIWPLLYPGQRLAYRPTAWGSDDDTKLAIDKILWVEQPGHPSLRLTIQERFRRPEYARYRDITLSDTCHMSGTRCELHHFDAVDLLIFGYFDQGTQRFGETVIVDVSGMVAAINDGRLTLQAGYNPRQQKSFRSARFDDLDALDLLLFHYNPSPKEIPDARPQRNRTPDTRVSAHGSTNHPLL